MKLTVVTYKKDSRKVHQLIHGFVQVQTVAMWIKTKENKQDSRLYYLDLLSQYWGKDNKVVQIKEAEAFWTFLIYKNEISI